MLRALVALLNLLVLLVELTDPSTSFVRAFVAPKFDKRSEAPALVKQQPHATVDAAPILSHRDSHDEDSVVISHYATEPSLASLEPQPGQELIRPNQQVRIWQHLRLLQRPPSGSRDC